MKLLSQDYKKGTVKVQIDHADDLWYLSQLIDNEDTVRAKTTRKVKKDDNTDATKKTLALTVQVEKIEFDKTLRINGTVTEGPEEVPHGSFHTIALEAGSSFTWTKKKWYSYQIDRLQEAERQAQSSIIICCFDREEALMAKTTPAGPEIISRIKGKVEKKGQEGQSQGSYYKDLLKKLEDYNTRYSAGSIIIASPSFWKEELLKHAKDSSIKKKIVQASCSGVSPQAINEVLKRPEVKQALSNERTSKELELVETLLTEISKEGTAAYGLKNIKSADAMGAIQILLITDKLISTRKNENRFGEIDELMKDIDQKKGSIHIISSSHDGGRKLDGLGGLGALLRFKMEY